MTKKEEIYSKLKINSTEALFNIKKQPENACPICDKFNKILMNKSIDFDLLLNRLNEIPFHQLDDDKEAYLFYINQIDLSRETIGNNRIKIESINELVEEYRYRCSSLRTSILNLKSEFWDSIEQGTKMRKLSVTKFYENKNQLKYDFDPIEFHPYSKNNEFFYNYLTYSDLEYFSIDLSELEELVKSLVDWGNQICIGINDYKD